jgi:2',3'-cyclic-nucleotide 2'-phosphodiesterase (5'-nucleotidase family)
MRSRMLTAVALAAAVPLSAAAPAGAASKKTDEIQILNVSDWHAQLDPLNGVGGAAALSTYWKADRAANPNTLTLTAGDAFGASPPLSGFFDEEPRR